MSALSKRDPIILFVGDIIVFFLSLWLSLAFRYGEPPTRSLFDLHALPFSLIFVVWILIFYIAGLYEKRLVITKNKLPFILLRTHIINSAIAVIFFYFIPIFGITPKTILFIYLFVSLVLLLFWRVIGYALFGPKFKQRAILLGNGTEMRELRDEVNSKSYYMHFIASIDFDTAGNIDFQKDIVERIRNEDISLLVVDYANDRVEPLLPYLYNLIFSGVVFVDMHEVYEDVFDRIPVSLIKYGWFMENISLAPKRAYDTLKRLMDILLALPLGLISLVVYPFIYIAMMFDEGRGLFSVQERVGQNNRLIKMYKFRTMKIANDGGKWGDTNENKVTKLGEFLRKTRLDELPQLWNVVLGDISLIGPRPEFPTAVKQYEAEIPYYSVRHLIKPGLSGWAQIYHDNHPHHGMALHGTAVDATKEKLSYDLYYLKNRSFVLDIIIALKTIKKLLSLAGK